MSVTVGATQPPVRYPSVEGAPHVHEFYKWAREQAPVHEVPGWPGVYVVAGYEDVRAVYGQPELFVNHGSRGLAEYESMIATPSDSRVMTDTDGPEHKAKRQLAFVAIKPGRLKQAEPHIRRFSDSLIDGFIERGHCEFVEQFARRLPLLVTLHLMGLPEDEGEWIGFWARLEANGLPFMPADFQTRQLANARRMSDYLTALIRERHASPGDDAVSLVIAEQLRRDGTFDLPEVRAQVAALLGGGVATTAHFLPSALALLLGDPSELRRVQADPKRIPAMVEEALRCEPPSQWTLRRASRDTELGGVRIPEGAFVLPLTASANRDPGRFGCPARFDVDRANTRDHMAFGYGPHFCLGAPLARLELRVAFERLIARLDGLALSADNDFAPIPSPSFRGLQQLHVEFVPGERLIG